MHFTAPGSARTRLGRLLRAKPDHRTPSRGKKIEPRRQETSDGGLHPLQALDQETGWDSLNLIGDRLKEGADDFYILNFSRLANRVDRLIEQASGV